MWYGEETVPSRGAGSLGVVPRVICTSSYRPSAGCNGSDRTLQIDHSSAVCVTSLPWRVDLEHHRGFTYFHHRNALGRTWWAAWGSWMMWRKGSGKKKYPSLCILGLRKRHVREVTINLLGCGLVASHTVGNTIVQQALHLCKAYFSCTELKIKLLQLPV